MPEETKFTPEQTQQLKQANAHGFINQLVTEGIPDPANPGKTKSCSVEEATDLYRKAANYQAKVGEQAEKVKGTIRESLGIQAK